MGSLPAVTNVAVLTALLGLTLLLHPSVQFTLLHKPTAQRAGAGPPLDQDAISAHTNLVTRDNAPIQARPPPPHTAPSSPPASDSTPLPIPPLAHTTITRPANSRKTNRGENFRTSHRLGETPTESLGKAEEGVEVVGKGNERERGGSAGLSRASSLLEHKQAAVVVRGASRSSGKRRQQTHVSDKTTTALHNQNNNRDIPFTQVVQVEVDSDPHHAAESGLRVDTGSAGIADSETGVPVLSGGRQKAAAVVLEVEEEEGESQLLQQAVAHRTGDPHVSKMVLTAIGSLTAVLGVCVMAAIFQCCCRRKRSTSSPDVGPGGGEGEEVVEEGEEKKGLKPKTNGSQGRASKSPSPHKAVLARAEEEEEEAEKGVSEKDSLLEENRKEAQQDEDNDLGDFSMVQRETSILRSYRKPPPPKNRARASRVPRALKGVDPKASPTLFQELVKNEQRDNNASETPPKSTKGLASPDAAAASPDMQSSMLADIDSTLAALHSNQDTPSPPKSAQQSRETSVEKVTAKSGGSDDSQLKTPVKPSLPASPSREKLAKALAQELARSVSKEMLAAKQPQSRQSTPSKGSKETTPKSESAGASPKPVHSKKDVSGSSSKDSVGLNSDGASSSDSRSGQSPEEGDNKKKLGNIFALIDPTTKDKGDKDKGDKDKGDTDKDEDAGAKSKIPVRAASSPTQPKAPLRLSSGKDKRFPVPSVHGDQMEQLMKSLKTRLKEDDGDSSKQVSNNKVSPEEASAEDDDLDPMGRDRSHSDPTKQAEERGKKLHQTHV